MTYCLAGYWTGVIRGRGEWAAKRQKPSEKNTWKPVETASLMACKLGLIYAIGNKT